MLHILVLELFSISALLSRESFAWTMSSRTNNIHHRSQQLTLQLAATKEASSLNDLLATIDDKRNVPSLQDWAMEQGVTLANGVKLVDNGLGDWGVGLSENHTHIAQTPIMTVPKNLVLSSADPQLEDLIPSIVVTMSETSMEYYVPECILMISILLEKAKGENSLWQPYLETLPKSFNTGIYLDSLEKSHVERFASEFLQQQERQFTACLKAIQECKNKKILPKELITKLDLEGKNNDLLKWVFSVVFTRSWRSPTGQEANLVPLGDMFNHDSEMANVVPNILNDGSIQMSLKEDVSEGSPLFLSYGMGTIPARFLVTFGFWDRSTPFMDANLTIPEEFSVDRSQLVVSTKNGGIAEEVWNLAIYHVLKERDPESANHFATAYRNQDTTTLDQICTKWELEGAMYLRLHALKIVGETYPDMDIAPENLSESPRRYGMIARYNNGMRESWIKVGSYLMEEIEYILRQRELELETTDQSS